MVSFLYKYKEDYPDYFYSSFYVRSIKIKEEFRNKGIGGIVMKNLQQLLESMMPVEFGAIFLSANTFRKEEDGISDKDYDELDERLVKFYSRCGFERIWEKGESYYNYMVKEVYLYKD
ncbi:MAG: hypothetical protein K9L62_16875 [Vallitaleaceae bacterium]|nr:hypothetical protein [Vallitaleaceae bacterium]